MPRLRLLAATLSLALAALVFSPHIARADVIDFDPRYDDVPEILTAEELAKYDAIRGVGNQRASVYTVSADGQKALVAIPNPDAGETPLQVLDTASQTYSDYDLGGWGINALYWTGDQQAKVWASRRVGNQTTYSLATLDLGATELVTETTVLPQGQFAYGNTLHRDSEGNFHIPALDLSGGIQIVDVETPTYAPDAEVEATPLAKTGEPMADLISGFAQGGNPKVVLVRPSDGLVTELGEIPAGYNLGATLYSVEMRPGHDTVAWIVGRSFGWAGEVINGRGNRGGGMPTGYFNVQENLGKIPEDQNPWITSSQLFIHDLQTGEQAVIENRDHTPGRFTDVYWSGDGEHLLVRAERPSVLEGREHPIYEYEAGVELKRFTPGGEANGTWTRPDMDAPGTYFEMATGSEMVVQYGSNTSRHLAVVDVADTAAAPEPVYTGEDILNAWDYRGGTLVAVKSNVGHLGDLYLSKDSGPMVALSDLNNESAELVNVAYENFSFTTSDGVDLVGTYVYPADWTLPPESPQPMVVWQAGGPGGQMQNSWGTSVESPYTILPAFGIPVMIVNGAGRLANGAAQYSAMADGTNYGQRDIREVREAVNALVEKGYVDATKVGVTGCSYGGYFSLQSIVEAPDFYAAANSQCSLNDMMYEYHFGWSPFLAYLIGDSPTGNPQEYIKDSPTYRVHEMKTPLLQFHGTMDFLFFEQITNIHDQLELNEVPTRFFRPIGYGHGIGGVGGVQNSGAMGQKYAFQLQLQWFREHLGLNDGTYMQAMQSATDLLAPFLFPGRPSPIAGGAR
jgi:dipeptidyl aminopeptidase/acylaminoacyl peptidase